MVPGASHAVADNQSFGERAAVMRASRADRKKFVPAARKKHGVVAHMPAHHAAIGNVANGHAAREISPFRLGLLSRHDVRDRRSLCRPWANLRPGGARAMNALPTALTYSGSIFSQCSIKPAFPG